LCASPGEKFGRLMTLQDELVGTWARVYTDLPLAQCAELGRRADAGGAAARDAKLDLAEAVVRRHDGADAARHSRAEFVRVFSAGERPTDMTPLPLEPGTRPAPDLVVAPRPGLSRSAAPRRVGGGRS